MNTSKIKTYWILMIFLSLLVGGYIYYDVQQRNSVQTVKNEFNQKLVDYTPLVTKHTEKVKQAFKDGKKIIRIALPIPLTGQHAPYGIDMLLSSLIAVDELNEKNLQLSGQGLFFALEAYDDKGDVESAIDTAKKVVTDKPDVVLGHMNSDTTIAAAPLYAQANLLHLSSSAINSNLTSQGFPLLFRTVSTDKDQTRFLAQFYNKDNSFEKKPVLIIHTFANVSLDFAQNFNKELTALNIPSKLESISDLADDFSFLNENLKKNQHVAFFTKDFIQLENFLQYIQNSEFKNHQIFSRFDCETRVARIKSKTPTVYCVAGKTSVQKSLLTKRFYEKFKQLYQTSWFDNGLGAYQSIMLLPDLIRQTASTEPLKWAETLHKNGAVLTDNTRYNFDEKGDLLNPPLLIQKVKDKEFSVIWHTE